MCRSVPHRRAKRHSDALAQWKQSPLQLLPSNRGCPRRPKPCLATATCGASHPHTHWQIASTKTPMNTRAHDVLASAARGPLRPGARCGDSRGFRARQPAPSLFLALFWLCWTLLAPLRRHCCCSPATARLSVDVARHAFGPAFRSRWRRPMSERVPPFVRLDHYQLKEQLALHGTAR